MIPPPPPPNQPYDPSTYMDPSMMMMYGGYNYTDNTQDPTTAAMMASMNPYMMNSGAWAALLATYCNAAGVYNYGTNTQVYNQQMNTTFSNMANMYGMNYDQPQIQVTQETTAAAAALPIEPSAPLPEEPAPPQ